jgi:hypothetical protein
LGQSAWDAPKTIPKDYVPDWMCTEEAPDGSTGRPPPEVPLSVTVTWMRALKNKINKAYMDELIEQCVISGIPSEVVVRMTPSMFGSEVRDRIRMAFKLHE